MKENLKEIKYFIIALLVAPAMIIHTAYKVWYFRTFIIKSGKRKPSENVGK